MQQASCPECGESWSTSFKFCPADGTAIPRPAVAVVVPEVLAEVIPLRPLPPQRPAGDTWKFGQRPGRGPITAPPRSWGEMPEPEVARAPVPPPMPIEAPSVALPALAFPVDRGAHTRQQVPTAQNEARRAPSRPAMPAAPPQPALPSIIVEEDDTSHVFVEQKRRGAAAFSDTAWFRRPIEPGAVDPETGMIAHSASSYLPDPDISDTEQRRFSLRTRAQ